MRKIFGCNLAVNELKVKHMVTASLNGQPLNWQTHWHPNSAFGYERRAVRTLQVPHSPTATWCFTSDDGTPVTVYPESSMDARGVFSQPGHYALLCGGEVAGYLFLDPSTTQRRPADAIDGREFGILPDRDRPVTAEFNAALAKLSANGGGTLALATGHYETGTVRMQSGVYLHLDAGAVLQATLDLDAHPLDAPGVWPEDLPRSLIPGTRRRLIYFQGVHDSGLLGPGTVCGNGSEMRRIYPGPRAMMQLVRAVDCRRLRFEGVTLRDSEFWNTHLLHCEDVLFSGVKVLNEIPPKGWDSYFRPGSKSIWNNADGINPDSSRRVTIERCFFHTGDDCVPVKNTGCYGNRLADVTDITVRNCLMRTPVTALKIGTETRGGHIGGLCFENIHIIEASRVIGLDMKDGAQAHDVCFKNIHVRRSNRPFDIWVIPREDEAAQTCFSSIRNVTLENVQIDQSGSEGANQTSHIMGRDGHFDVQGVHIKDLTLDGRPVRAPSEMDVDINPWVGDVDFC